MIKKALFTALSTILCLSITGCKEKIDYKPIADSYMSSVSQEYISIGVNTLSENDLLAIYAELDEDYKYVFYYNYFNEFETTTNFFEDGENTYKYTLQIKKPKLADAYSLMQTQLLATKYNYEDINLALVSPEIYKEKYNVTDEELTNATESYLHQKRLIHQDAFSNKNIQYDTISYTFIIEYNEETNNFDILKALNSENEEVEIDYAFSELYLSGIYHLLASLEYSQLLQE